MAVNTKSEIRPYSEVHILNQSFDATYQVLAVELLGYDTVSGSLKRLTTNQLGGYATNAIDEASATVTYIGKEDADGAWMIQKIDTSSGTAFTYATVANNATKTTYATAWADRASLTYQEYSSAF